MEPTVTIPTNVHILFVKNRKAVKGAQHKMKTSSLRGAYVRGLACVIFLPLVCASVVSATVLVSVVSDQVLVIASDGAMYRHDISGKVTGKEPSCKIRLVGNQVVAHAGLVFEGSAQFDFWRSVGSVSSASTSEFVSMLSAMLSERLEEVARARRGKNLSQPDYRLTRIEVYVAGWDPDLTLFELVATLPVDGVPVIKKTRVWPMWDEGKNPPSFARGGIYQVNYFGSFDENIRSNNDEWISVSADPLKYAGFEVQKQIDGGNQSVGSPVTVVRIDKSGPKWVELGACHDQGQGHY